MSNAFRPSPLETEQRLRFFAAAAAAGMTRDAAVSLGLQTLRRAPRTERASTTFRRLAERLEAR